MRRVFISVGRGVAVLSVVVLLALDASAAFQRQEPGLENPFVRIVQFMKKTVRSLGDGLIIPRP